MGFEILGEFVEWFGLVNHELEKLPCDSLEEHECIGIERESVGLGFDTDAVDDDELQSPCWGVITISPSRMERNSYIWQTRQS